MSYPHPSARSPQTWAFRLLLLALALLGLRYQWLLLNYREWGDESETIVTVKMMAAGMRLYAEIFNHHGPLTFLPGLITETMAHCGVIGHRIPIAAMQWLMLACVYGAPTLHTRPQRIAATVASALVVLLFLPDQFGHMYKYQTMAGLIIAMVLAQYTLTAIARPQALTRARVLIGNGLIVSLPFLAITYLPLAVMLAVASLRPQCRRLAMLGGLIGLLANMGFLLAYGSVPGFLAYHIYLNAKILPLYAETQPGLQLIVTALHTAWSDAAHGAAWLVLAVAGLRLGRQEGPWPWRTLLVLAGLLSLLMRGAGFHGMPFFYAVLPWIGVALGGWTLQARYSPHLAVAALLLISLRLSLLMPTDDASITGQPIPTQTEFSTLVQRITAADDRIIAYSFQNFEYLAADRLPASGHFFYLPWQKHYNEQPWLGVSLDACAQIKQAMPKVMLIDQWQVWGRFDWHSYGTCIQELLDTAYQKLPGRPYYVRHDIYQQHADYFLARAGQATCAKPIATPPDAGAAGSAACTPAAVTEPHAAPHRESTATPHDR